MRAWFDTEFIEDGVTIDLISIGMVREDGEELYLENAETKWHLASQWIVDNVKPHLGRASLRTPRDIIASRVREFAGENPIFWGYYADYDWVVLCQLFGRMIDLPTGWPKYCRDLKQLADQQGVRLPEQTSQEHHALADARWVRDSWIWLQERS